jgi:hypothetical protein
MLGKLGIVLFKSIYFNYGHSRNPRSPLRYKDANESGFYDWHPTNSTGLLGSAY